MQVQEVSWDDARAVALRNEQAADLGARYGFEPSLNEPQPDGLVCMLILVDDQGEPIGCVALVDQTGVESVFGPERTVEMRKVFVRPPFRKQGLSYLLIDEAHRIAKARDFQQIVLVTGVEQPEAVAVYKRRGYRELPAYGFNAQFETSLFYVMRTDGL